MSVCMSLCEHESCSLEACINQVNGLLNFLHINRNSLLENKELYVTLGHQHFRDD